MHRSFHQITAKDVQEVIFFRHAATKQLLLLFKKGDISQYARSGRVFEMSKYGITLIYSNSRYIDLSNKAKSDTLNDTLCIISTIFEW